MRVAAGLYPAAWRARYGGNLRRCSKTWSRSGGTCGTWWEER